jgi:hypothetical protein
MALGVQPLRAIELGRWCAEHGSGFVADTTQQLDDGVTARLNSEPAPAAPFEIGGVEAGWYGKVLVVQTLPAGASWPTRLASGFDAEVRRLLVREVYSRAEYTPEATDRVLEAMTLLGTHAKGARASLAADALFLAAPSLGELRWQGGQTQDGFAFLQYHPDVPGKDTTLPLSLEYPVPRAGLVAQPERFMLAESGYDEFAVALAQAGGGMTLAEYRQRQAQEAAVKDRPFAADARLDTVVQLDAWDGPVADLATALGGRAGVKLVVDGEVAAKPVHACLHGVPARQVLMALARVAGATLLREGDLYRLAKPAGAAEQLAVSAPLSGWCAGQEDRVEARVSEQALRERVWEQLDQAKLEDIGAHPLRLERAEPALRHALTAWAYHRLGRRLKLLIDSLPDRAGGVSMWLVHYTKPDIHPDRYELVTPAYSEMVGGLLAMRVDLAISGEKCGPLPAAKVRPMPKPNANGEF